MGEAKRRREWLAARGLSPENSNIARGEPRQSRIPQQPMGNYKHREAFCLMLYANRLDWTKDREVIWNSRDGVVPFLIARAGERLVLGNKDQVELNHVRWDLDKCCPNWARDGLQVGHRIFGDLTLEHAKKMATVDVDKHISDGYDFGVTREEAIEDLAKAWAKPGNPCIFTVDKEMLDRLRAGEAPL
jgi:hypothetical protein